MIGLGGDLGGVWVSITLSRGRLRVRGDLGDSLDLDRLGLPLGGALTGGLIGYCI